MTLTVTPADYTTCEWFLDGKKVNEGKSIEQQLEAGTYDLKIVATTTAGKSTSREGLVKVKPLDGDPTTTTKSFERFVAPVLWPHSTVPTSAISKLWLSVDSK